VQNDKTSIIVYIWFVLDLCDMGVLVQNDVGLPVITLFPVSPYSIIIWSVL